MCNITVLLLVFLFTFHTKINNTLHTSNPRDTLCLACYVCLIMVVVLGCCGDTGRNVPTKMRGRPTTSRLIDTHNVPSMYTSFLCKCVSKEGVEGEEVEEEEDGEEEDDDDA